MNVAHFTSKLSGGASIAALRLHRALQTAGVKSLFYHGAGTADDASIVPLWSDNTRVKRMSSKLVNRWRCSKVVPHGHINSPKWIRRTPFTARASVINLHSVFQWLDLPSFFRSIPQETPVVWSLHDCEPITGGCIYPGTCTAFTEQCGDCPQLKSPHPCDLTRRSFRLKQELYQRVDLHLVGNSSWTATQAAKSGLASCAKSIRTINLGLDIDNYRALSKTGAREALGIAPGKFLIGFACTDINERRKGAHLLIEALRVMPANNVAVLVFGSGSWPKDATNVETISLGHLGSTRLQSLCYSALDALAMPSLAETFGMVAMEAMACETPVAAYQAGGLTDLIQDGQTGLLEPEVGSVAGLVRMLERLRTHAEERQTMGKAARKRICEHFTSDVMARKYEALYGELLQGKLD